MDHPTAAAEAPELLNQPVTPLSVALPAIRIRLSAFAAAGTLVGVFLLMSYISWEKWPSVVIDGGREMNFPLRILNGETIYSEAFFLYGPLAPYVNGFLYKVFGANLNTLYFAGFFCSITILLMVFHIARRIMPLLQATLATLAVMTLCVFKQGGHTIFPYAFSALYGTTLSIAAFAAQLHYAANRKRRQLIVSGILIGLALICKLEYGFAAVAGAIALAISARPRERKRTALWMFVPSFAIPMVTYGFIAWKIPFTAWFIDTYSLPHLVPAELIFFNLKRIGLDQPVKSISEIIQAIAALIWIGAAIGLVSFLFSHRSPRVLRSSRFASKLMLLMFAGLFIFVLNHAVSDIDWFISPIRALPVMACAVVAGYFLNSPRDKRLARILFLIAVFSFAILLREITRVASGGAYAAFLLPVPLVLFTYLTTVRFPQSFAAVNCELPARRLALLLFIVVLASTAKHVLKVYLKEPSAVLHTTRGVVVTPADVAPAFVKALSFIARNTSPGESIFAAPEGSSLNFLANRPVATRYEVLTPGFLDLQGEIQTIHELEKKRVRYIFILNRATPEFGPTAFGDDYDRRLMEWINNNYRLINVFGNDGNRDSQIGNPHFFIKCYQRHSLEVSQ